MFDFPKALSRLTTLPTRYSRIAGCDTETTGVHLHHHDYPFMMSFTYNDGESILYTAEVDPMTRLPLWTESDLEDMLARLEDPLVLIVFSNAKFDVRALSRILKRLRTQRILRRCHDTIFQHHALNNNESHALKDAAVKYAKIPDNDETDIHRAANAARSIAKKLGWKIASKIACPQQRRAPNSKGVKGGWAVMDMWLPRAVAKYKWETSPACRYLENLYKLKNATTNVTKLFCRLPSILKEVAKLQGWDWRPDGIDGPGHKWWTLAGIYCSFDTLRSVVLHNQFIEALADQGLLANYLENRTAIPISYATEERGVSINCDTARKLIAKFEIDKKNAALALNGSLSLKTAMNPESPTAIRNILYSYFNLPVTRYTKPKKATSVPKPTTDADFIAEVVRDNSEYCPEFEADYAPPLWDKTIEAYGDFKKRLTFWSKSLIAEEKPSIPQLLAFCTSLLMYKKANTSIRYLNGYLHSAIPVETPKPTITFQDVCDLKHSLKESYRSTITMEEWANSSSGPLLTEAPPTYAILHPSLNPIGTKTTRYSSSNPNGQNISKGGKGKKGLEWLFKTNHSLRSVFGPIPGREWWSFDYHQIQLVIFAILCGDEKMVAAVHRGDDFHTFMARQIFGLSPEEKPTEYQRDIAKTVNFAFVFGAQESKLERTAGMPGLYKILCKVFPAAVDFLQRTEWEVRAKGYVVTPGGYRLYVPDETPYAGVNYKVQGAEGEIVKKAQYGIQAYLDAYNESVPEEEIFMTLYVHDELVFDAKKNEGYKHVGPICRIMNDAALSYGFPSRAAPKIIVDNWAEAKKLSV